MQEKFSLRKTLMYALLQAKNNQESKKGRKAAELPMRHISACTACRM
jgi:hypothetical protein